MPDDPHEIVTLMYDQLDELEQKILVDGMNAQEQAEDYIGVWIGNTLHSMPQAMPHP
jgi:hypothetical protein